MRYILIIILGISLCFHQQSHAQSLIVGDTTDINITYSNIPDTSLPYVIKDYFSFYIDIDFDSIHDISFYRAHNSSPSFVSETYYVFSLNTIEFITNMDTVYTQDADTLIYGSTIDHQSKWNSNYDGTCLYYNFVSNIPEPWGLPSFHHGICVGENRYLGFRKINQADTLYGWFNYDLSESFTIKSFAVNKRFNTGVISEEKSILVYPNPAQNMLFIKNNNTFQNAFHISLLNNMTVEVVSKRTVNNDNYSIDLSSIKNGIYFLLMENNDYKIIKKIIIYK